MTTIPTVAKKQSTDLISIKGRDDVWSRGRVDWYVKWPQREKGRASAWRLRSYSKSPTYSFNGAKGIRPAISY